MEALESAVLSVIILAVICIPTAIILTVTGGRAEWGAIIFLIALIPTWVAVDLIGNGIHERLKLRKTNER